MIFKITTKEIYVVVISALISAALVASFSISAREMYPDDEQKVDYRRESLISELADLINKYRERFGLQHLIPVKELALIADEHSNNMSDSKTLSHNGFVTRARKTGSPVCVENVARGYTKADRLLEGWQNSNLHDKNLTDPSISKMGIAKSDKYITFFACR